MRIVILGAGLAGLEAGRMLHENGKEFLILEKEPHAGGLCRTIETGQYRWDFGVHALYSRHPEAMEHFRNFRLDYQASNRNVRIMHYGRDGKGHLIDYPFENGVKDLPFAEKMECLAGYVAARLRKRRYHNLREWINNRLGFGIAKHFMIPYNEKIWNCPLQLISEELVSSKIEPATAVEFMRGILGPRSIGRAYQSRFIYPRLGIQTLCNQLAADFRGNIALGDAAEDLVRRKGRWVITARSGSKFEADAVISTIPLVELLKIIENDRSSAAAGHFRWNNTFFVMVGLKKDAAFGPVHNCHWVFFKGDEIFYRITMMHAFSDAFPPALVAEVTEKGDAAGQSEEAVRDAVVKDLLRLGIVVSPGDIAATDVKKIDYTYPIPTVGLAAVRQNIRAELAARGLFLLGRSGAWEYLNMDGVYLSVRSFAEGEGVGSW